MATLLEKARLAITKPKIKSGVTEEDVELAIAWFSGEIRGSQVCAAYGEKSSSTKSIYRVSVALREAVVSGKVTLTVK